MIKIKSFEELFDKIETDLIATLDGAAFKLAGYSNKFIDEKYRGECATFWPLRDSTKQLIPNPKTGEPFSKEFGPIELAQKLKTRITKGELKRIITVCVDLDGVRNADSHETAGRLMETFGCRPWGKLKSQLSSTTGIASAIK